MNTSALTRDAGEHDAPGAALVEGRTLTKGYDPAHPERLAPRGVDLAVAPGEMVAIMGPSGCGKSTLLHLLGGLDVPTDGAVILSGRRLDTLSETKRALVRRRDVGYVFQFFNLIANLSVADGADPERVLVRVSPDAAVAVGIPTGIVIADAMRAAVGRGAGVGPELGASAPRVPRWPKHCEPNDAADR